MFRSLQAKTDLTKTPLSSQKYSSLSKVTAQKVTLLVSMEMHPEECAIGRNKQPIYRHLMFE